jgi:hypothetical protein
MNREELMAAMRAAPFEMAPVTVPGWGTFRVRELTAGNVDKANATKEEGDSMRRNAVIVACIVCDEKGTLLFNADNKDDVDFLIGMGMSKLNLVLAAANKLGAQDPGN